VPVLNQTPPAFYQLMQADRDNAETGKLLSLRFIISGGEAPELKTLEDRYERHPDHFPRLSNTYGITATTVHVSYISLDQQTPALQANSLIGPG
ncbi:AMP-binding protein, partial [Bacillus licheniformis]